MADQKYILADNFKNPFHAFNFRETKPTYLCEQTFFTLMNIKTENRNRFFSFQNYHGGYNMKDAKKRQIFFHHGVIPTYTKIFCGNDLKSFPTANLLET